ncbi:MAG: hypothetical protein JSW73_04550 [Candidatus Woesearchaeota archaeon]|nr:MAG: hypothetical protein JSW73_04550 [Candidatus Woesearchaeota archaeon]
MEELKRITHKEFLLSHEELAKQKGGNSKTDNTIFFIAEFNKGDLDRYRGTFVAYQKGVLCGQSKYGIVLYNQAKSYYGGSSLSVLRVPKSGETLDSVLKECNNYGLSEDEISILKSPA